MAKIKLNDNEKALANFMKESIRAIGEMGSYAGVDPFEINRIGNQLSQCRDRYIDRCFERATKEKIF